jgi:fatty-acyl-CoA synthase
VVGTLIELIRWWAIERADEPAIVTVDDRVTYRELDRWADAVADWLIGEGLMAGDRVSIYAANSLAWCVMAQGVMRAGGLTAPINPRFTVSEASYMLGRVRPRFLLHDDARAGHAQELGVAQPDMRVLSLDVVHQFRGAAPAMPRPQRDVHADSSVVIIPTSGSTGYPKGVVLSHRSMLCNYTDFALAHAWAAEHPRIMVFGPLCTSAGFYVLHECLVFGGTAFIEEAFDAHKALKRVADDRITILMGAPVFFERMAACPEFADTDMSSVRMVQSGGARVSRQLLETWMKKGLVLQQMYGQTEAGGNATINSREDSIEFPEKCGRGMPCTRLLTVDTDGRPCPPNVPGEILIKGPGIMVGYWDDPAATAKAIVNGWLHTGDLGAIDESGLLTMLDRLKDIIISGGLNISAAEVERVIAEFPGIDEVAVIAANDDRFGETPLAVIYSQTGVDVGQLVAHCSKHLSDYKVVRYVAVHAEPLPRLATGKISKVDLRKQYADAHLTLTRVR